jgi:para-nitrobenzyl esterase
MRIVSIPEVGRCLAAVAVATFLIGCSPRSAEPEKFDSGLDSSQVEAAGETLRGEVLDSDAQLTVFRGIPFAAAPVAKLRWQPPRSHTPREGIQQATQFGGVCPQGQGNADFYKMVAIQFGKSPDLIPATENIQEDCLYLNVWTTALRARPQPVMVWIYGGGNSNGYAHDPDYFGHSLAKRGVVFVSFNYRVGQLGYMAHPGLSAESLNAASGNYGILDQLHALRWVEENIAAFGGDPENITILGESAGGANIATLIASPLGAGLFHRAIIQSGGYEISSFYSLADAESVGTKVATLLGFESRMNDVEIVDGMRDLGWRVFVEGLKPEDLGMFRATNIDGYVLPQPKAGILASGSNNNVDVIIGTNANESFMWQQPGETAESFRDHLATYGEPFSTELRELLADDIEADLQMAMDRFGSAETFLCGSRYIAKQMSGSGSDVYFYYFTRVRPGGEKVLAYHGAEIPYALDTAAEWLPADETDKNLTAAMSQYWLNFAITGDPNGEGLPEWPRYAADDSRYQELGDDIKPGAGLEPEICDILDRHRATR